MDELKIEEYNERLWQIHLSISDFFNEYAISKGLTFPAFKVLGIIYKKNECTQKEITQLTHLPKQTVNAIINNFYKQGIIQELVESQKDKRNKVIIFSEYGKEYAENAILQGKEAIYRALNSIGEEKRNLLVETMELFRKNLYIEEK